MDWIKSKTTEEIKKEKDFEVLEKIKGFVTEKCGKCNNVIREEYEPIGLNKPCKVCGSNVWIKIKMKENK